MVPPGEAIHSIQALVHVRVYCAMSSSTTCTSAPQSRDLACNTLRFTASRVHHDDFGERVDRFKTTNECSIDCQPQAVGITDIVAQSRGYL
jgi:hypothetical protein